MLEWLDSLNHRPLADGPGGEARLTAYRPMTQAHGDFLWTTVVVNVRLHDIRSQAARQAFVKLEEWAKYGFVLRQPSGSVDWKPEASRVMPEDPTVVARGLAGGGRGYRRKARAHSRSSSPCAGGESVDRGGPSGRASASSGSRGHQPLWQSE